MSSMNKFEIPENPPAKSQITARISPKALEMLLNLAEAYDTSQAKVLEGLLNTYGAMALEDAFKRRTTGDSGEQ